MKISIFLMIYLATPFSCSGEADKRHTSGGSGDGATSVPSDDARRNETTDTDGTDGSEKDSGKDNTAEASYLYDFALGELKTAFGTVSFGFVKDKGRLAAYINDGWKRPPLKYYEFRMDTDNHYAWVNSLCISENSYLPNNPIIFETITEANYKDFSKIKISLKACNKK